MSGAPDLIYLYDGTFDGFLCCVYESVYAREQPVGIEPESEAEPSLFAHRRIATDSKKAARVYTSIGEKIGPGAHALVRDVFCSCMEQRELALLTFLQLGYRQGGRVLFLSGHPDVQPLLAAQAALLHEAHAFLEFIRFAQYGRVLVSEIEPKNFVLPYLQAHFCSRLMNEDFLIYDKTHRAALVWQAKRARLIPLDALELPAPDAGEQLFQALWKRFYDTIAIPERENARCRMSHCPKRYWANMCEMRAEPAFVPEQTALEVLPKRAAPLLNG